MDARGGMVGLARARLPPRARAALRHGRRMSWYVKHRLRLRQMEALERRLPSEDGLPVPPPSLRFRVTNSAERAPFLAIGKRCADDLMAALTDADRPIGGFRSVLDFGCGCGRVLRHVVGALDPAARVSGTDIDGAAMAWCCGAFPSGTFTTNGMDPPLTFEAGSFDLVYAISVFTHLDEAREQRWLAELQRVCRPGGTVVLTTHGDKYRDRFGPEDAGHGFLFRRVDSGALRLDGMPDEYQVSFHTREYVEQTWPRWFDVVGYVGRGLNDDQDIVILQRR